MASFFLKSTKWNYNYVVQMIPSFGKRKLDFDTLLWVCGHVLSEANSSEEGPPVKVELWEEPGEMRPSPMRPSVIGRRCSWTHASLKMLIQSVIL